MAWSPDPQGGADALIQKRYRQATINKLWLPMDPVPLEGIYLALDSVGNYILLQVSGGNWVEYRPKTYVPVRAMLVPACYEALF